MIKSRLIGNLVSHRCFHTSPRPAFKFKLTEEISREFEEKQKAKEAAKEPPKLAQHTLESSLIMGRISHDRYNKVVKVGVPKHRLNEFLLMYIREQDSIYVYDEKEESQPGDWVLLRRLNEPIDEGVNHKIEKIVYKYGNFVDPITKRRSFGLYYDDDMQRLEKIKIEL